MVGNRVLWVMGLGAVLSIVGISAWYDTASAHETFPNNGWAVLIRENDLPTPEDFGYKDFFMLRPTPGQDIPDFSAGGHVWTHYVDGGALVTACDDCGPSEYHTYLVIEGNGAYTNGAVTGGIQFLDFAEFHDRLTINGESWVILTDGEGGA